MTTKFFLDVGKMLRALLGEQNRVLINKIAKSVTYRFSSAPSAPR